MSVNQLHIDAIEALTVKESAGTLLYRTGPAGLEVLLVHPSGPYNRRAPWSIPKGLPGDEASLEETARRETLEETGVVAEQLVSIGSIEYQKSRKRVHCFVGPAPKDADPRCASWEVDQARFVTAVEARGLMHPDQKVFIDRLEALLNNPDSEPDETRMRDGT
jgi:predicted NUDIX family NTP pyrophosphohydrolase